MQTSPNSTKGWSVTPKVRPRHLNGTGNSWICASFQRTIQGQTNKTPQFLEMIVLCSSTIKQEAQCQMRQCWSDHGHEHHHIIINTEKSHQLMASEPSVMLWSSIHNQGKNSTCSCNFGPKPLRSQQLNVSFTVWVGGKHVTQIHVSSPGTRFAVMLSQIIWASCMSNI